MVETLKPQNSNPRKRPHFLGPTSSEMRKGVLFPLVLSPLLSSSNGALSSTPTRPLLPGGPCRGVSPSGLRFLFIQPEHTGTDVVVRFFSTILNVTTCGHDHKSMGDTSTVDFAFAFARNPFQRLLSNAGFRGIISGRLRAGDKSDRRRWAREVAAFRTCRFPLSPASIFRSPVISCFDFFCV